MLHANLHNIFVKWWKICSGLFSFYDHLRSVFQYFNDINIIIVANAPKTALIFLNLNPTEHGPISIKVGSTNMVQEPKAKLLGIQIDEKQDWKTQINEMVSSLNSRLFLIRRLNNYIGKKD